ncbi:MAG: response regulator transcription factor [Solirubrobacteraceae bacterium]|nr:response regulator transcription factor [Solirubrobacteraceae bacterium]
MSPQPGTISPLDQHTDHAVRVLIVDAHEPTRLGLALLLQRQPWVERCYLAGGQERATELARRFRPAIAVVDISNLGPFVAPLASALRAAHPALQIVLTARCGQATTAAVRQADAVAFLPAGTTGAAVVETVRVAVLEDGPIPQPTLREPAAQLSNRERQVLELLATGATNREIAAQLHLGPDSVKKHASSLYRKLGVRNRTEATQRAPEVLSA